MSNQIFGRYHGEGGPLFALYVKTTLLTLLTLGLYRFWAKTRMRKYIWSAVSGDGDSFEYTGTGLEKFLGFLVALIILAIYLGIVQMILFYFGIFLFDEPETQAEVLLQIAGVYITAFAVVPLLLFARYRARRYRMSRTRWRGLRFGMDSAAWGYVIRGILYWLLTLCSLGILLPLQTFRLEKYMTDRTWYGDARFRQDGRWTVLYGGLKHVVIALTILFASIVAGAVLEIRALMTLLVFVGLVWFAVGVVYYRIYAFNYLSGNKSLDDQIDFGATAETGEIVKIWIVGVLVIIGISIVAGIAFVAVIASIAGLTAVTAGSFDTGDINMAGVFVGLIVGGFGYIVSALLIGGVALVLVTQKILAHMVQSVAVNNTPHLDSIRQRVADKGADAEGFADALDIGGAF